MPPRPPPHADDDALRRYALGRMTDAEVERLAEHLAGCPECEQALADLTNTDPLVRLCQQVGRAAVPAALARLAAAGYTVGRQLGQGGLGQVYAGADPTGRGVALKVIRPDHADNPALVRRFVRQEARTLSLIAHPNVVRYYDLLFADGDADPVLVMELVRGESLKAVLDGAGARPIPEAAEYARQLLKAVEVLSEYGIVHRDIKPGNCVRMADGRLKLVDFGIAKDTTAGQGETVTGQRLGTPAYMAPEQIENAGRVSPRTDLYAVGCVLYHLLVGRPPFTGNLAAVLNGHANVPAAVPRTVPRALARVLERLLAKSPDDRFQTATETLAALDAALAPPSNGRRVRLAVGVAVVALAGVGVAWAIRSPADSSIPSSPPPVPPVVVHPPVRATVADGVLTVDGRGGAQVVLLGQSSWTDYTMKVEAKWDGTGGGVYVRTADEGSGHRLRFGITRLPAAAVQYGVFQTVRGGQAERESDTADFRSAGADEWVPITVSVRGGTATATVKGVTVARWTDGDRPLLARGRIGFGAEADSVCQFRRLTVTGTAGEVLLTEFEFPK